MALFNGTNVVADTTGLRMSKFSSGSRPGAPVEGQVIWNTDTRKLEMYDGGYWKAITDGLRPYLYRTIITTGYVYGGYKNSSPWKNANRMTHATSVCTNIGDVISVASCYTNGACNLTSAFIWGCDPGWPGVTTVTCAFNMATETNKGLNSAWNTRQPRAQAGTIFKETFWAYIFAGGSGDVDVMNLTTEVMYVNSTGPDMMGGDGYQSGAANLSDENAGYAWQDGSVQKLLFSNTVAYLVTDSSVTGSTSQQKGINTKLGKGYCGNEGSYSGGYTYRRYNFATDTNIGNVSKPIGDCGEENLDMGQDHQYLMGQHDGTGQNNRGHIFSYVTDSGYELGSGSVRTGVPGGSSGHCAWKG
jgi:hypothetical protein